MKQLIVKISGREYPVLIGENLAPSLKKLLLKNVGRGRPFVFFDANLYALHGRTLERQLSSPNSHTIEFVVPSGEKAKSSSVLAGIYDFLLANEITRDDFIIACGGGVTSDLVGYAAATTLRGIRWGVVPTTLLSMVDASIGGKTGINHARGKNLIGAFWQPSFVCSDLRYLMTLDERQMWAGLGEVAKTAGLAGGKAVQNLARFLDRHRLYDLGGLSHLVWQTSAYKAQIVASDERDAGTRMILNYGHTFAHGIEKALGYGRLLHGEAVIIGTEAALALGERRGHSSAALSGYRSIVTSMLSHLPKHRIDPDKVWQAMALDKKRTARDFRFVILKSLGKPIVVDDIKFSMAKAALDEALETYHKIGRSHA